MKRTANMSVRILGSRTLRHGRVVDLIAARRLVSTVRLVGHFCGLRLQEQMVLRAEIRDPLHVSRAEADVALSHLEHRNRFGSRQTWAHSIHLVAVVWCVADSTVRNASGRHRLGMQRGRKKCALQRRSDRQHSQSGVGVFAKNHDEAPWRPIHRRSLRLRLEFNDFEAERIPAPRARILRGRRVRVLDGGNPMSELVLGAGTRSQRLEVVDLREIGEAARAAKETTALTCTLTVLPPLWTLSGESGLVAVHSAYQA